MGRVLSVLLALILVSSFFVWREAFSANTDIVINEIGSYPTSTHEWIEIWNKGNEPVDMADWKFWENNTNHGLSAATGSDSIVAPGEYAAIVQDDEVFSNDHPDFLGSIFDSVWTNLSENGESIGLKDAGGNFAEQFIYVSTQNYSLERRDPYINDYSVSNWQEHGSGNTLGAVNSNFTILASSTSSTAQNETPPPTSTESVGVGASTGTIWSQIKINEIMVNPINGEEWVELYNPATSSLDLTGGALCDSRTSTTCIISSSSGTILALGWRVFYLSSSRLNNSGDTVILKNPDGAIMDQVRYGSGGAGVPGVGYALARRIDGGDSGSDSADWAVTTQPTPGAGNAIVAPVVSAPGSGGGSISRPNAPTSSLPTSTTTCGGITFCAPTTTEQAAIILNEIFPNPSGSDANEEFIEIKNSSTQPVDLRGWRLADLSSSFNLYGTILPGQIIVWPRRVTRILLNNTTREEVKLYNVANVAVDSAAYNNAPEGQSYNHSEEGVWQWSARSTPGQENIIVIPDATQIVWKINAPLRADPGEMMVFDAEDSADPRGGALSFSWNFGDSATSLGGETEHAYATSGVYTVVVSATSSAGTSGEKSFTVNVGRGLSIINSFVILNEIAPNPEGDDSREFIELHNSGSSTADVSGWLLRHQSKVFQIPSSTRMSAQSFLVFYRAVTRFGLGNSGDKVELLSPDREVVDMVRFGRAGSGESYGLVNGEWRWAEEPTPGRMNVMIINDKNDNDDNGNNVVRTRSVKSTKKLVFVPMSIAQARGAEKEGGVKVRGVVNVKPGVFGSQYFYITDGVSGVQVYQHKKEFPDLEIGDLMEVKGTISEANGQRRIKVKSKNDFDILRTNQAVAPASSAIAEVDEQSAGRLLRLTGEITEIKSNFMYIDDGVGELAVYFKKGAMIDKKKFKEGENVEVTGIVEVNKSGDHQIWPRSQEDVASLGLSKDLIMKQATLEEDRQKETAEKYLTATAGGLTTLLFGFLARARGAILRAGLRRAVALAARIIRRG